MLLNWLRAYPCQIQHSGLTMLTRDFLGTKFNNQCRLKQVLNGYHTVSNSISIGYIFYVVYMHILLNALILLDSNLNWQWLFKNYHTQCSVNFQITSLTKTLNSILQFSSNKDQTYKFATNSYAPRAQNLLSQPPYFQTQAYNKEHRGK